MDDKKIIKLVQRKFPVLDVEMDLGEILPKKSSVIKEIGDYKITLEYAHFKVIIRKVENTKDIFTI